MLDAVQLAWFVVRRCSNRGFPISNLQLQKILYFLQRNYLKTTGLVLFKEKIEAWQFGPVVPIVYDTFFLNSSLRIVPTSFDPDPKIELPNYLLEEIDYRSNQDAWKMVNETHEKGKAWDLVYKNGLGNKKTISTRLILQNG